MGSASIHKHLYTLSLFFFFMLLLTWKCKYATGRG